MLRWYSVEGRGSLRVNAKMGDKEETGETEEKTAGLLSLRLLGRFGAARDGNNLDLPKSRKARALLAYLGAQGRPVSREALCEMFFSEAADPRGGLRWCVSRLRHALNAPAELLTADSQRVALRPNLVRTDLQELETRVSQPASLDVLIAFENLIDGGFLEDLALDAQPHFEAWRLAEASRYRELHAALLGKIIAKLAGSADAVDFARKLTRLDPASESAWATLVDVLAAAGERREARQVLHLAQDQLDREGVEARGPLIAAAAALNPRPALSAPRGLPSRRPILAVLPVQAVADDVPAVLLRDAYHALYGAASSNKCCTLSAQSLVLDAAAGAAAAATAAGADLLLESQLQAEATGLVLTAQLSDAKQRSLLCSWRVEVAEATARCLRETLLGYLSCRLELDIPIVLVAVARSKAPEACSAWDLYYLALAKIYTPDGYSADDALELLEQALGADRNIGPALCASAWVRSTHPDYNLATSDRAASASMARRAVEVCQDDAFVMGWGAICIAVLDQDLATARDLARRALTFNAFSTMALIANGIVDHYAGESEQALKWIDRAEAAADTEPLTFLSYTIRSMAAFQLGDVPSAIAWGRKAVGKNPRFVIALRALTAALSAAGELDEAKTWAARLVAVDPTEHLAFYREYWPYADSADVDKLCAVLAVAGVPSHA